MIDVINQASNRIVLVGCALVLLALGSCAAEAPPAPSEGVMEEPAAEGESPPAAVSVEPELVALPELDMGEFPPEVADQIRPLYEQAVAAPEDGQAAGTLGMMLHAHLLACR